jgi:hypothetical protein
MRDALAQPANDAGRAFHGHEMDAFRVELRVREQG